MDIADKIKDYRKLESKKDKINTLASEKIAKLKLKMSDIKNEMLAFFNDTKQESVKTEYGTAYTSKETRLTISDPVPLYDFIITNQAIDLLQKRINKKVALEYIKDKIVIPGIKKDVFNVVKIRKS